MSIKEGYSKEKIFIFDIDDTIVITDAKIIVTDSTTGETFSLSPEDFNSYQANDKHVLNFDEFKSLDILKAGKIIQKYLDILEKNYKKGNAIGVITARDDQDLIFTWLKEHVGFHVDKKLIFAVNDPIHGFEGKIADRKKQAFESFIEMGYTSLTFFDDDRENIKIIKKVSKEHPELKIKAVRATH